MGAVDIFPEALPPRRFVGDFLRGCVGPELLGGGHAGSGGPGVLYSVELPGGVHFVALDNVKAPRAGLPERRSSSGWNRI